MQAVIFTTLVWHLHYLSVGGNLVDAGDWFMNEIQKDIHLCETQRGPNDYLWPKFKGDIHFMRLFF